MTPPTTSDAYGHMTDITVRFHDIDGLGHVNNARYLNYLEQARISYARDVCGWDGVMRTLNLVIANVHIDFTVPVHLEDALRVYTRVSRLGNKSFDFQYLLMVTPPGGDPVPAATATTTAVAFDYAAGKSIPVFPDWRAAILAHEPELSE